MVPAYAEPARPLPATRLSVRDLTPAARRPGPAQPVRMTVALHHEFWRATSSGALEEINDHHPTAGVPTSAGPARGQRAPGWLRRRRPRSASTFSGRAGGHHPYTPIPPPGWSCPASLPVGGSSTAGSLLPAPAARIRRLPRGPVSRLPPRLPLVMRAVPNVLPTRPTGHLAPRPAPRSPGGQPGTASFVRDFQGAGAVRRRSARHTTPRRCLGHPYSGAAPLTVSFSAAGRATRPRATLT